MTYSEKLWSVALVFLGFVFVGLSAGEDSTLRDVAETIVFALMFYSTLQLKDSLK